MFSFPGKNKREFIFNNGWKLNNCLQLRSTDLIVEQNFLKWIHLDLYLYVDCFSYTEYTTHETVIYMTWDVFQYTFYLTEYYNLNIWNIYVSNHNKIKSNVSESDWIKTVVHLWRIIRFSLNIIYDDKRQRNISCTLNNGKIHFQILIHAIINLIN